MNSTNDEVEILKRRFWAKIKPEDHETTERKIINNCSIYISSTNLKPPSNRNIEGWTYLGSSEQLIITAYKQLKYFEFDFEKSTNCIEELFILKHYSVLITMKEPYNIVYGSANKTHLFNNNNEFYLFNGRFYFTGFTMEQPNALFTLTYFVNE